MAEKEERILCIETYEKIAECGYGDFYNTITRKEAIERMAKAISKAFLDDKGNSQGATDKELAEAALNSLLEK